MHVGGYSCYAHAYMGSHDYLPGAKFQELGQIHDAQAGLLKDRLWRALEMCSDFVTP